MNSIINWLEQHLGTCYFHKYIGIQCPGCGFQRAFIELLKGNLTDSLKLYPALIPIIIMFLLLGIHLKFNLKNGALILKVIFIFTAIIIAANYIFKIINHKIY